MGKIYISFLGTNDYLPCTYCFSEQPIMVDVRFVQEATIKLCCHSWNHEERVLIFTTDEAYEKNWLDNGHRTQGGQALERLGLNAALARLGLNALIERVPIPDGKSEQEIWNIFQILFDRLAPGDQVIFDITHAFRSIPMLAMVVLNYAKVFKQVSLDAIYYGAFEVLGSFQQARQLPLERRVVPVFDLTAFGALLDWTVAMDRFLAAGDSSLASRLARKAVGSILRNSQGRDNAAVLIRKVADRMEDFTEVLTTCRGLKISQAALELKKQVSCCEALDLLPAFKPLLSLIRDHVEAFDGQATQDGIRAARWYLEHSLIQQGYTILQETLIGHFVILAGGDLAARSDRDLVTLAACIFARHVPKDKWGQLALDRLDLTRKYLTFFEAQSELATLLHKLSDARNDLHHAGFRKNPRLPGTFPETLAKSINIVEKALTAGSNIQFDAE